MFKRILYITFIVLLIGAFCYFYIQVNHHSEVENKADFFEIMPNNPGIIVEIPKLNALAKNDNLHSEMWNALSQLSVINSYASTFCQWDTLTQTYPDLKKWGDNPAIASYHLIGKKMLPFYAVKFGNKATERTWKILMQSNGATKVKDYNGVTIYKLDRDIAPYAYLYKGCFAISASDILLEQSIRATQSAHKTDEDLDALRKTKGNGADMNIYINYERLHLAMEQIAGEKSTFTSRLNHLGNWGEFDYSVENSNLIFNGFSNYNTDDYWQIFAQQTGVKMSIHNAIPSNSKGFVAFCIDDMKQFRKDFETYLQHDGTYTKYQNWLKNINKYGVEDLQHILDQLIKNEIAYRHNNLLTSHADESLVIIKTNSASSTLESLNNVLAHYARKKGKQPEDYRSALKIDTETTYDLYSWPFEDCFSILYGHSFSGFKANYYCMFGNYLIFGTERQVIKKAITANILKQTFSNDADFVDFYNSFSDKNSLFYFETMANLIPEIKKQLGSSTYNKTGLSMDNVNNFYALAYQMVPSDKFVYNSILLNYNSNLKDKPLTVWSSQLDAAPVGKPQFVKNHYTQENEICVQDKHNNLYLISNSGRIIWKKPIGEPIMGEIYQIDYFRNGKLQLLFNTPSKLWLLDRDGNYVERYPILLPSPASTGISLFDYDNNRDYRIFVPTEDKHVYLYNKDGNINKGFSFETTEYPLTMPVQHFKNKGKDYLVFADKNRVYILNRKGQRRIKVNEQFSASPNNSFYFGTDEAPFIATTDIDGNVMKIYLDGKVKKIELPKVEADHYFAMENLEQRGSNNFVIVNNDKLVVYNYRGRELYTKHIEKADFSRPYFYEFAANVTKIGVFNKNKNEIYLFNGMDGKTYKDFPLIGTSPFTIGFLTTSAWRFNLIVGGENGSLYNYKVK